MMCCAICWCSASSQPIWHATSDRRRRQPYCAARSGSAAVLDQTVMSLELDLQYATIEDWDLPASDMLRRWAEAVLAVTRPGLARTAELSVRIVEEDEGARLNREYRHKEGATNVLSFPVRAMAGAALPADILGDIVICAPVVAREA